MPDSTMFKGIRFQVTLIAALMVAIVLVVAGYVLVARQRTELTESIDRSLEQRADDVVNLLEAGEVPDILAPGRDEGFTQLIDRDGHVIASTPNLAGEPALSLGAESGGAIRTIDVPEVDDDGFRVLSRTGDHWVLHIGTTYDIVGESTGALISSLALIIPSVMVILAAVVWWLVGRTLRPVESIRTEVASIGSSDLTRRVPQPGGGDEIDRLAATMNDMLERLESSIQRQTRFTADASHELRTPLTRLRADIETGLAAAGDFATSHRLRALLAEVTQLQDLIDDLLYLARADAGQDTVRRARLDLDDLVVEEARAVAANGIVQVDSTEVSGAQIRGDAAQIRRMVRNLLANAERHAVSRIAIALGEIDDEAILTVTDDGPGIPRADAERVFERFGRLDEARSPQEGRTGLGLSIALEIAEHHGGTIRLVNPGETGAKFETRIPTTD
jgi:signal transduction histidine kinase